MPLDIVTAAGDNVFARHYTCIWYNVVIVTEAILIVLATPRRKAGSLSMELLVVHCTVRRFTAAFFPRDCNRRSNDENVKNLELLSQRFTVNAYSL